MTMTTVLIFAALAAVVVLSFWLIATDRWTVRTNGAIYVSPRAFRRAVRLEVDEVIARYADTDQPVTPEEEEMLLEQAKLGIIIFRNVISDPPPESIKALH
jgi:hypothetical protein